MGTALGLLFIVAAAATGVFVGTRPTVMDGRWIAAKLTQAAGEREGAGSVDGAELECDREISVGVAGAEFACSMSTGARLRFRMSRDGKLEQIGDEHARPGRPARGAL